MKDPRVRNFVRQTYKFSTMTTHTLAATLRETVSGLHKGLRRKTSPTNLYSMTEMETIGFLARNPGLSPSELATLARVKNQTMSQILNKLDTLAVIKRTHAKDDKRKVLISLSIAGKKMVEKVIYERDEWLKQAIEKSFSEKERKQLKEAMPLLTKLLTQFD